MPEVGSGWLKRLKVPQRFRIPEPTYRCRLSDDEFLGIGAPRQLCAAGSTVNDRCGGMVAAATFPCRDVTVQVRDGRRGSWLPGVATDAEGGPASARNVFFGALFVDDDDEVASSSSRRSDSDPVLATVFSTR